MWVRLPPGHHSFSLKLLELLKRFADVPRVHLAVGKYEWVPIPRTRQVSKSLGNFYTMRDLYAKGYKPSALRYALASVPYRRQLNFTFDGLTQATNSVERLRTFADRLKQGKFPAGSPIGFKERAAKALDDFDAGLADDLNTAVALAAAFDFLREANIAMDSGKFGQEDAAAAQEFLKKFDEVFAVIADNDAEKLNELGYGPDGGGLGEADVEAMIAERQAARQRRDFAKSDEIRKKLAEHGIILEDSKDGSVRWKRK
jgi:cysteinyl-tRNA synthetase